VFRFDVAAFDVMQNLFGKVLAMGDEDEAGENGNFSGIHGIAFHVVADEWEANESEEARENAFSNESEERNEEEHVGKSETIVVDEQCAQGGGDAFAAMKAKLRGPDMANDDGDHGESEIMGIARPMAGGPNGEGAFSDVAEQGHSKAGPAEGSADIFCADAAAALFADIASGADADEIVASGETTEHVSAQYNPACLGPIRRLNLLNPRHSCLASTHDQRSSADFVPNSAFLRLIWAE